MCAKKHETRVNFGVIKTNGKNISLLIHIDSSLLGGLIVKYGSKMIDTSIRTKLNNLELAMKGAN